uniref:Protein FAR1-RELATED SEQUENCE n=1 Tax=Chenopodium quinoa TaxID=63459 RepID=A0A803LY86_CHEQI
MSEGIGCLLGGKGEDEIFEEDEVMLIGDDKMGDNEGNMVVDYVEGSGESGGYRTLDEKECKSMVNMDCVSVDPPEVGMIFDTWQEADMYYNAYGKQQGFGVVLAQSAYKVVGGVKVKRATTWKCGCYAMKHMFWAGMKTTQRSESIHNFFDDLFDKHTSLCDFVEKYVRAMEHCIDAERLADGNSAMYLRGLH